MGDPPSLSGTFQLNVNEVSPISDAVGVPGGLGLSENNYLNLKCPRLRKNAGNSYIYVYKLLKTHTFVY